LAGDEVHWIDHASVWNQFDQAGLRDKPAKQVRIATRCTGWRESAINDWMRNPMFYSANDQQH